MSFRVTPELKRQMDAVAASSGRSVAQEVERLIQQGLLFDQLFGGELRNANITMCSTFEHAGKAAARVEFDNSLPATWLKDPLCRRVALAQTVMAMLEEGPEGLSLDSARTLFEWIADRLKSRAASGFIEPEGQSK